MVADSNRGVGWELGLTVVICLALSGSPTIVLLRHARIANIARVFDERTSVPAGRSLSRCRISSRSMKVKFRRSKAMKDAKRTLGVKLGIFAHGLRYELQPAPRRLVLLDRDLESILLQHAHIL
jgi:hypothetical protein